MGKPVLALNHAILKLVIRKRGESFIKYVIFFSYLPNGVSSAVVVKLCDFIRDFCVLFVLGK